MSDELYAGDESSGFLTHFVGRVKKSFWSNFFAESEGKVTNDYAQTTLLFWNVDVVDILQANYDSSGTPTENVNLSLGIGNGWHQDPNNPNLVEHEDDTPDFQKKFHATTALMKFAYLVGGKASTYEGAIVLDGDGQFKCDLTGVRKVHAEKGVTTLRDASVWDNLIFEFRGLGFKTRNNPDPRAKPLPIRYMGYDESEVPDLGKVSSGVGNSTPNSAGAARSALGPVPATTVEQWSTAGASDQTVATLTRLWDSSPTVDHFINNAGMLPDVKNSEDLAKAIVDTPDPTTASTDSK